MKNKLEIEDFITIHNVKSELLFLFQEVLNNNSEKDLDLINKNISINVNNINYIFSNYTFLIFSVPILKNDSVIGFYSLEYDDSGKVIDEEDVLWGIESMMDAWLTAGRFSIKLERELARYFGSRFSFLMGTFTFCPMATFEDDS